MITQHDALSAAQGMDLQDLLNHIAWTDVLQPRLQAAKALLTNRLVEATLNPQKEGNETREQIAGKLFGINWIEVELTKVLRSGTVSREKLASENIFIS